MTEAIAVNDTSRDGLPKIAAAGVVTGLLTPLLPPLIDKINGSPGDFRIALVAIPFAILVFFLVRRLRPNPWWAALMAAIVTMIAFVCAVNAAILVDGQASGADKVVRNMLAGLAGGFTGATVMALGICLLPAGPRDIVAWLPMLVMGTVAGALLALGQCARSRSDLGALSGLAGRRRGHAGDGAATEQGFLTDCPAVEAVRRPSRNLGPRRSVRPERASD